MPTLINEIPKVFLYGETLESEELNEIIDQINSAIRKLNNIENNLVNHGYSSIPITNIYCRTKKGINAINFFPLVDDKRNELLNLVSNCNSTQGIKYNINFSTVTISEDKDLMNGVWTAYPQGISASLPHEWEVSYKKLEDNSIIYVSGPVLYSNYGYNGTDGDSVQYIYKIFDHKLSGTEEEENTPFKPENPNSDGEYIPFGWKDNPQGPTREYPFEYVAILKKIKGNWEEKFEKISLWSTFSESGDFLTRVFCRYTPTQNKPAPNTPIGGTYNNPLPESNDNIQWSLTIPAEDNNNKGPIWTSVRIFKGTNEITEWSTPVIEADSAEIDIEYSSTMERPLLSTLRNIPNTAHPSNNIWHDPSETNIDLSTMVWRAERKIKNGQYIGNWVITKITGLRGDFKSFVFRRFKPTLEQLIPPAPTGGTYDNPIPDGGLWSDGLPPGNTSDGLIWTSSRTFTDNGIQSAWSTPRVLSDNDTLDIEFSPGIGSDHTLPNNPEGPPFTNREDSGWYDPSSINFSSAGTMFWRAERKVQNGQYLGGWVVTRIIGENGTDGNGFEYIFKGFRTEQTSWNTNSDDYPPKWINSDISAFRKDDYLGPSGHLWADNAIGVNDTDNRFVYVCSRKKYVDEGASKATWHAFSIPVLWNLYAGTSFMSNIFKRSPTKPNKPGANEGSFLNPVPSGWSDGIPAGTDSIWITSRIFSSNGQYPQQGEWNNVQLMSDTESFDVEFSPIESNPGTPTTNSSNWYDPTTDTNANWTEMIWMATRTKSNGAWGNWNITKIKGEQGKPGKDGTYIEYVYTRNNTGVAPAAPATTQTDDWHGTSGGVTWTDNPQGVEKNMMYEFVSIRTKENNTWSAFSPPVIWSKWGEKGQDGDGFEYIFKAYTSEQTSWDSNSDWYPPKWINSVNSTIFLGDDFRGPTGYLWADNAIGVNNNSNKFVYVSSRRKYVDNGAERATWHTFSEPKLWALYVLPGGAGPAGINGSYTQFIFKTTDLDLSNSANYRELLTSNSSTPSGWSSSATSASNSSEYVWSTHRLISYNSSNEKIYGAWQDPYKVSGPQGPQGSSGSGSGTTVVTTVYLLVANISEIRYKRNHAGIVVWIPDTFDLQLYKFEGTTFLRLTLLPSGYSILRTINGTNTESTSLGTVSTPSLASYTSNGNPVMGTTVSIKLLNENNDIAAILNLSIIREFLRMLIPMGAYVSKRYDITDTTVPLVLGSNGKYYYLDADTNEVSNTYVDPTTANQTVWGEASEYEVILTKALFANFAKLGSFIVYENWFISMLGILYDTSDGAHSIDENNSWSGYELDSGTSGPAYTKFDTNYPNSSHNGAINFVPNIAINAKTGKTYFNDSYINGNVNASSGTFNGTVNASSGSFNGTILASGGSITGDVTIGSTTNGNTIMLSPNTNNWGASIIGKVSGDQYINLGYELENGLFEPKLKLGYMNSSGTPKNYKYVVLGGNEISIGFLNSYNYYKISLKRISKTISGGTLLGHGTEYSTNAAYYFTVGISDTGVAMIHSDSWPTNANDIPYGMVWCDRSNGDVLKVRYS